MRQLIFLQRPLRISIKANCVDSTAAPEAVFASEIDKLRKDGVKPKERGNRKRNNSDKMR